MTDAPMTRRLLLSAALSSLVAVVFVLYFLMREERVVSVSRSIPPGSEITPDDLGYRYLVRRDVHPDALHTVEEAVGRYALTDLVAGEVVLGSKLGSEPRPAPVLVAGRTLDPSLVLIGIPTSPELAVGGLVEPGDSVNLIWVPRDRLDETPRAELFAQKVQVAAVIEDGGMPRKDGVRTMGQAVGEPSVVVVMVGPSLATEIAARISSGSVVLALTQADSPDLTLPLTASLEALEAAAGIGGD